MKKIEAAKKLNALHNSMETRTNSLSTTIKKMYKDGENWRLCGIGYDYIVDNNGKNVSYHL